MKKFKKKHTKKYKNIYLVFLLVISVILSNYQKYTINNNNKTKEEQLSYFINYSKYDLSKDYVYVGDDSDFEILSNISISSATGKIEEDKLIFHQWDIIYYEATLVRINFNLLKINDKNIIINDGITYEEFVSNITTTNATYKIFNENEEITSGNIQSGMQIKIYYNEEELDYYNIISEYINLDKLTIKDNKYIIKNISTVENLKKDVNTNANIIIQDKDGDYITTNSKLKISSSNNNYEYTIVVIGDITGSGDIFIGDVSKLYQYYKKTIAMEECYIIAGDVTYDNIIEINDIAKLYQYYKGTINSLE